MVEKPKTIGILNNPIYVPNLRPTFISQIYVPNLRPTFMSQFLYNNYIYENC